MSTLVSCALLPTRFTHNNLHNKTSSQGGGGGGGGGDNQWRYKKAKEKEKQKKPKACQHVIHQGNSVQHVRQQLALGWLPATSDCPSLVCTNIMLETNIENSRRQEKEMERWVGGGWSGPLGRSKSIWRFSTRTCPIHEG